MRAVGIVALSFLAGAVVYALAFALLRNGGSGSAGLGAPERRPSRAADLSGEADSFVYVGMGRSEHVPIRTRLLGLLGIVVLVAATAVLIALAVYQAGHFINEQLAKLVGR